MLSPARPTTIVKYMALERFEKVQAVWGSDPGSVAATYPDVAGLGTLASIISVVHR